MPGVLDAAARFIQVAKVRVISNNVNLDAKIINSKREAQNKKDEDGLQFSMMMIVKIFFSPLTLIFSLPLSV